MHLVVADAERAWQRRDAHHIFLEPGDYFVGGQDYVVRTLLGSCVSIVLWHPQRRLGAMSHFLLGSQSGPCSGRSPGLYADQAIDAMARELALAGAAIEQCIGKLFGGGDMFPEYRVPDSPHVGYKNGEAARALLAERGVVIAAEDLFGVGHRDVTFDVSSGDVWVRHSGEML